MQLPLKAVFTLTKFTAKVSAKHLCLCHSLNYLDHRKKQKQSYLCRTAHGDQGKYGT